MRMMAARDPAEDAPEAYPDSRFDWFELVDSRWTPIVA